MGRERNLARLARRALAGDEPAADALFAEVWPRLRAAVYAISADHPLAEDIAQDAMEVLVARLDELRDESQLSAWLASIALNRARNVMRREARSVPSADAGLSVETRDASPSDPVLLAAVRELAPERREVIALRYWLDLRPVEIAAVLDVPEGTVHSRLSRAVGDLRARMEVEDARV